MDATATGRRATATGEPRMNQADDVLNKELKSKKEILVGMA